MATKKTALAGKKSTSRTAKKSAVTPQKTTTKVTRVSASSPKTSTTAPKAAARTNTSARFSFRRAPLLSGSVAEFIGVFVLAAVVLAVSAQQIYILFAAVAVVLAVGGLSGAHLNPAVTVGAWVTRKVTATRAISYLVAQVLGAVLALVVLTGFIGTAPQPDPQAMQLGQQSPTLFSSEAIPEGKEWMLLAAELLGVIIFTFMVAGIFRKVTDKLTAAFTYGGAYFVGLLIAGTAASYMGATAVLNPALATSVQAVEFQVWPLIIYVVTPLIGGIVGFALSDLLNSEDESVARV